MRSILFLVIHVFCLCIVNELKSQIVIDVVYPKEGQEVTAVETSFILGSVQPNNAQFFINGNEVNLYNNGAFLAILPIEQGNFAFICTAITDNDTSTYIRNVYVPPYLETSPSDSLLIDTNNIKHRKIIK